MLLVFTPPAHAVRKDTKLILDQIQKLSEGLSILQTRISLIHTETTSMSKRIDVLEQRMAVISRSQADSGQNKESLTLSLQFIKEELNELKNSINKVNDRLINMPANVNDNVGDNGSSENEGGEISREMPSQSPQTTYYTAYSDYIKKNYQLAIEGFNQFIKLFPQNQLADNSLYWIGECYYSQKKYQDAVDTFTRLINNYPDGDKIPDAILKKGYALIEMGDQDMGVTVLKDLISKFPLSEEASLAQQKIKDVLD
jgi:tol-pal system protein YbgF